MVRDEYDSGRTNLGATGPDAGNEPQEIEEVVGLQESRPAQTDTELFVQMLTALKEEQLPPGEEMKRKQKIHGMVFVTAS